MADGKSSEEDYYALLGLDRNCTHSDIRNAYRILAKRYHPDLNHDSPEARERTQELNAAYEILSDPARRRSYDREREQASQAAAPGRASRIEHNITQEVRLRIEDFLRGTSLTVTVRDPANPNGPESYSVVIPPLTAPGSRLRLPRHDVKGHVQLKLKVLPNSRFKARGADIRTDLRISSQRAASGGTEMMARPSGGMTRVTIPARVPRGEILSVPGEGLPKPRGGRGDLLVRITYRPEIRVSRHR